MKRTKIDIEAIIRFYDHADTKGNARHASAVTGVLGEPLGIGLFTHYLEAEGWRVHEPFDEIPKAPKPHKARGSYWLDFWLYATREGKRRLYQVEVKNWSAHSLGGRELSIDADADAMREHARERWRSLVDEQNRFKQPYLGKVIFPGYVPPAGVPGPVPRATPLACLWTVFHPTGRLVPRFTRTMCGENSAPVGCEFFSMSAYLRMLRRNGKKEISVVLPRLRERVDLIRRMFNV